MYIEVKDTNILAVHSSVLAPKRDDESILIEISDDDYKKIQSSSLSYVKYDNGKLYFLDEPLTSTQKQAKIKALQDKYQAEYDAYLAKYPQAEVSSFDDKKREAIAYNLDNTTPTPIIDSILAGLGDDKATYINSILAKVQFLAQKEGAMVKTRDAIKACTTQDELDAIVI